MGGCAVQSVWIVLNVGHRGRREPASRDGDRRGDRAGLYDLRRHVLRRHSGLCPNLCDHGRAALYCFCGEWVGGRGGCGDQPCGAGRQVGFLSTGDVHGVDSLHRSLDHDDVGVDSPTRRVSTHHLGERRTHGGAWISCWAARSISVSALSRCFWPMRRR